MGNGKYNVASFCGHEFWCLDAEQMAVVNGVEAEVMIVAVVVVIIAVVIVGLGSLVDAV